MRSGRLYIILLLTIVPLVLINSRDDAESRLNRTLAAHPELKPRIEELKTRPGARMDDLFALLPGHRIDGAMLPRESWAHWPMAILSAAVFFGVVVLIFPAERVPPGHIALIGLFTGTVGVLFLLMAQHLPIIGHIYLPALDPRAGFGASFIGFTFGVGFCEEVCKSLPLLWYLARGGDRVLGWRGACIWGLASGAGFGISEGIHYGHLYNGVMGAGAYVERFISCVGLHVMFSGAAAIMIYRHRRLLAESAGWLNAATTLMAIIAVPMFAHGLYDTLLKKEMNAAAVLVDAFAFAWLAWQIEATRAREQSAAAPKPSGLIWNGRGWVRNPNLESVK